MGGVDPGLGFLHDLGQLGVPAQPAAAHGGGGRASGDGARPLEHRLDPRTLLDPRGSSAADR